MKNLGKVVLKYIIAAIIFFVAGVVVVGYINDNVFGFSSENFGTGTLIMIAGETCLLLYDLFRLMDGKGKKKSKAVFDALSGLEEYKAAKSVCVYMDSFNEVKTDLIIEDLRNRGKDWRKEYNNFPMRPLGWLSPKEFLKKYKSQEESVIAI